MSRCRIFLSKQVASDIIVEDCIVFSDPYEEADEQLKKEREEEVDKQKKKTEEERKKKKSKEDGAMKVYKPGVGKYISTTAMKRAATANTEDDSGAEAKKKKSASYSFGSFSSW